MNVSQNIVLIVEDEMPLARAVEVVLSDHDVSTVTITNGEDAKVYLSKNTPALVVLDLLLPGIDGFAVLEYIRKELKNTKLPVIVLTNYSEDSAIKRAKNLGVQGYIVKTDIDLKELPKLFTPYLT